MKRKTNLLMAATFGLLFIALLNADSFAQNRQKQFGADTGVRQLGPNQKLRVIITPASDVNPARIRVRRCLYTEQTGVLMVSSSEVGPIITIAPGEARFFDVFGTGAAAIRFRVASPTPDIVVTFQLIDTSTGEVIWESFTGSDEELGALIA
jgi:hypothetical protein